MPSVLFETTISAAERPQTYALDRVATGTGTNYTRIMKLWGVRRLWQVDFAEEVKMAFKIQAYNSVTSRSILRPRRTLGGNNQQIITNTILHCGWDSYGSGQDLFCALKYANRPLGLNFKRRIKSHLPFAGIIRSSPYSPRFQDKG